MKILTCKSITEVIKASFEKTLYDSIILDKIKIKTYEDFDAMERLLKNQTRVKELSYNSIEMNYPIFLPQLFIVCPSAFLKKLTLIRTIHSFKALTNIIESKKFLEELAIEGIILVPKNVEDILKILEYNCYLKKLSFKNCNIQQDHIKVINDFISKKSNLLDIKLNYYNTDFLEPQYSLLKKKINIKNEKFKLISKELKFTFKAFANNIEIDKASSIINGLFEFNNSVISLISNNLAKSLCDKCINYIKNIRNKVFTLSNIHNEQEESNFLLTHKNIKLLIENPGYFNLQSINENEQQSFDVFIKQIKQYYYENYFTFHRVCKNLAQSNDENFALLTKDIFAHIAEYLDLCGGIRHMKYVEPVIEVVKSEEIMFWHE